MWMDLKSWYFKMFHSLAQEGGGLEVIHIKVFYGYWQIDFKSLYVKGKDFKKTSITVEGKIERWKTNITRLQCLL